GRPVAGDRAAPAGRVVAVAGGQAGAADRGELAARVPAVAEGAVAGQVALGVIAERGTAAAGQLVGGVVRRRRAGGRDGDVRQRPGERGCVPGRAVAVAERADRAAVRPGVADRGG